MIDSRPTSVEGAKPEPTFAYRWTVLVAMSVAMFGSYYAFDCIGPLAPLLSRQLHFSDSQIGLLQASYSLPNIIIVLAGGIMIDRIGTKKSTMLFGLIVFAGIVLAALSPRFGMMVAGRLLIGIGAESLAMATNVAVARWFWKSELSMSFGVRGAFCRLGSLSAQTSPTWAPWAYASWQLPLLISVGFGSFCVIGAGLYWILDSRGERRFALGTTENKEKVVLREAIKFTPSFWLLGAVCITFYGCLFPFQTFGQKFLIDARHTTPQTASLLVGMLPLFSLVCQPFFGHLVDRFAKRSLFMMVGSLMLVPVFLMLAYTDISPIIPMAIMGLAFGLVPVVLWMSVVYVVDRSRLGFANGVMDAVQQLGLVGVNLLIGGANDHSLASAANPAGYRTGMWIFSALAIAAVLSAFLLRKVETGPRAHGLETITAHT
jgi:MFS family permease